MAFLFFDFLHPHPSRIMSIIGLFVFIYFIIYANSLRRIKKNKLPQEHAGAKEVKINEKIISLLFTSIINAYL